MIVSFLLDIAYTAVLGVFAPVIVYRRLRHKRYRTGWAQRFGRLPRRTSHGPCVWVHAVSLGEVNAAASLARELIRELPNLELAISTTTDTGYARAQSLFGRDHLVFFFPFDFSCVVRRALDRLRPDLCVFMELEVWPNFTAIAQKRGIPLVVANGRISPGKGWPRYRRIAPLVRPMFRRLDLVLTQDETYAERFRFLGARPDCVQAVGSLKYDTAQIADTVDGADLLARQLGLDRSVRLLVAGSTGPDEEAYLLAAFESLTCQAEMGDLRLAIVPRKPERFDEVARLIESRRFAVTRYSRLKGHPDQTAGPTPVILGDTLGDLRKFYSLATVIFVGRSLVPMGGSDMIEAAALGKPVLVGPHTENFSESVAALEEGRGIIVVPDASALTDEVSRLLRHPDDAAVLAGNAREVIAGRQGATKRSVDAIIPLLGYQPALSDHSIATPLPIRHSGRP